MEKYVSLLKANGLKVTPQRLGIMKYLDEHMDHPTADRIYQALKEDNPSLSKTTIYNTLESLREHGIVQVLTISPTEQRYDFARGCHHHFHCRKCMAIIDIDVSCPFLEEMAGGKHRVEEVHGYFRGICRDCLEGEEPAGGTGGK